MEKIINWVIDLNEKIENLKYRLSNRIRGYKLSTYWVIFPTMQIGAGHVFLYWLCFGVDITVRG